VAYADEVAAQREVDLILEQSSLANALRCLLHGVVSLNTREMLSFIFIIHMTEYFINLMKFNMIIIFRVFSASDLRDDRSREWRQRWRLRRQSRCGHERLAALDPAASCPSAAHRGTTAPPL
jgi:hypothetical protein